MISQCWALNIMENSRNMKLQNWAYVVAVVILFNILQ